MVKRTLLVGTLLLAAPGLLFQNRTIAGPGQSIPASFFGMHFHDFQKNEAWPTVEFASWRLWDTGTDWEKLEPQKDHWDFTRLDALVQQAKDHHVKVLLTLGQTPAWASSKPDEKAFHGMGAARMPKDIADWDHYIEVVATRYKGRIEAYEVWNEPSYPRYFLDSPADMATLTKEAANVLHRVDPDAKLVSASPTSVAGLPWLKKYMEAGGGNYADAIGYHLYVFPNAPEAQIDLIKQVKAIASGAGAAAKPIWDTESTWGEVPGGLTPGMQRAYLSRSMLLIAASGVARLYWYSWDNHNWANIQFVQADNRQTETPVSAYSVTRTELLNATIQNCTQKDTTWACVLKKADGLHYAVWSTANQGSWTLPFQGGWTSHTLQDQRSSGTGAVTISAEPQFISKQ